MLMAAELNVIATILSQESNKRMNKDFLLLALIQIAVLARSALVHQLKFVSVFYLPMHLCSMALK